jgi:hypothetical protein
LLVKSFPLIKLSKWVKKQAASEDFLSPLGPTNHIVKAVIIPACFSGSHSGVKPIKANRGIVTFESNTSSKE